VDVYLVDGTYELFRHYYALPPARDEDGREVAAVRGVLSSVLGMIRGGATHIAVATDHVIAMLCGPATRPAKALTLICWRNFQSWRVCCQRQALLSGRWLSSKPTMRWRPQPYWLLATRESNE